MIIVVLAMMAIVIIDSFRNKCNSYAIIMIYIKGHLLFYQLVARFVDAPLIFSRLIYSKNVFYFRFWPPCGVIFFLFFICFEFFFLCFSNLVIFLWLVTMISLMIYDIVPWVFFGGLCFFHFVHMRGVCVCRWWLHHISFYYSESKNFVRKKLIPWNLRYI